MEPMYEKEELRCVSMESGVQFVMTLGMTLMLELFVHRWDIQDKVRFNVHLYFDRIFADFLIERLHAYLIFLLSIVYCHYRISFPKRSLL